MFENNGACRLCEDDPYETRDHLFWSCNSSKQCWQSINIRLDTNLDFATMLSSAEHHLANPSMRFLLRLLVHLEAK